MLMESSFSASRETTLLNTSENQHPFAAFYWMSSLAETYQMIHKLPDQRFLEAVPVPDELSCPEKTVMHKVSEKALTSLVYSRRKRSVGPEGNSPGECKKHDDDSLDDSIVPVYNPGETIKGKHRFNNCLVYNRKKKRAKTSCVTGMLRADDGLFVYSRRKQRGESNGARVNGFLVYKRKKPKANSITDNTQATTEVTSSSNGRNDRCSSQSSSELASGPSKTGENEATDSDSPFRQCKGCDKAGNVEKMLICDECEEAYHTRCCGVQMKEVAEIDDWFCRSCLKKESSKIKGRLSQERKWRVTEPFVIGVRVGKEFQADVPDWSGPTMSDTCFVGEPLEIDQSEYMHDFKNGKKPGSAVNWVQCREEDRNGDICGKWRRAPRSEVQTNDWECFCCVFWDPSHADCAVPQELETDEILKQLKVHQHA